MGIINKRKLSLVTENFFVFASKLIFFLPKKLLSSFLCIKKCSYLDRLCCLTADTEFSHVRVSFPSLLPYYCFPISVPIHSPCFLFHLLTHSFIHHPPQLPKWVNVTFPVTLVIVSSSSLIHKIFNSISKKLMQFLKVF